MSDSEIPNIILKRIVSRNIEQLAPAWIQVDSESENIVSVGGDWHHYFEAYPEPGSSISSLSDTLHGIMPIHENFELPQMQLRGEEYTDIYALQGQDCDWLLFCDVTQSTLKMQRYQQTANELTLLKNQLDLTMNRYIGSEVVERVASGELQFNIAGERKVICTMFVDIRGFTVFNEKHDPQLVMHTLNSYMDRMLQPVLDHAGMVDKITGDGAMCVFGVLPSEHNRTRNAFVAAQEIQHNIKQLNHERRQHHEETLGVGVGIATGEAVLGVLGAQNRRSFTAIGPHVNLAARLESTAMAGEILLDEASYQTLQTPQSFTSAMFELKGIGRVRAYAFIREEVL